MQFQRHVASVELSGGATHGPGTGRNCICVCLDACACGAGRLPRPLFLLGLLPLLAVLIAVPAVLGVCLLFLSLSACVCFALLPSG